MKIMKRLFTNFFYFSYITVEFISNISLKRKMSKQDHNNLLTTLPVLKTELFLSYEDMRQKKGSMKSASSNNHNHDG